MDFEVAGAFEFFVDDVVHPAAGVDQRSSNDRQRAAFFDVASRAEEALGFLQGVGVDAAGQYLSGSGLHGVVSARQTGDRVEQDDHVFFMFDQPLGLFDHHLGNLYVARGGFVKGRGDDFTAHRARHFRDLFWALVDQQNDQGYVRVVTRDGVRNMLHHHRLAALRAGYQQAALAFADRRDDVDDTAGGVFFAADIAFELDVLGRVQRRQVFEEDLVF